MIKYLNEIWTSRIKIASTSKSLTYPPQGLPISLHGEDNLSRPSYERKDYSETEGFNHTVDRITDGFGNLAGQEERQSRNILANLKQGSSESINTVPTATGARKTRIRS
jgi:hypothetical protein